MSEPILPTRSTSEPTLLSGASSLFDRSTQELGPAADAIIGGDDTAARFARDIQKLVDGVNGESRRALATAERLYADDVMNPQGRARQLAEIPANLMGGTTERLQQAEDTLGIIEALHLGAILRHNTREDTALIAEIQNYVAGLEPTKATETLVGLASDVRYSTMMAGPFGRSLAARFKLKDSSIFTKVALQALAVDGTEDQVRRSQALASIEKMRLAIGLARGGRDQAVQEVQRPPKPKPSTAMMS